MKKVVVLTGFMLFLAVIGKAQQNYAEMYAAKVADRMKISLSLNEEQKNSIYAVNLQISNQKAAVWQQYSNSDSLIRVNLHRIEVSRDSLYKLILGTEKFELYKTRKQALLNNN